MSMAEPAVKVDVIGAEEAADALKKLALAIAGDAVPNALKEGAQLVVAEVKASIAGQRSEPRSVDTGQFKSSVTRSEPDNGEIQVFSDVEHAIFPEYGTINMPPRRHFRNSADRTRDDVQKLIQARIKQATSLF